MIIKEGIRQIIYQKYRKRTSETKGIVTMEEYNLNADVTPGIHPYAQKNVDGYFNRVQKKIVGIFKTQWYVTKADHIKLGASEYNYILIKAPQNLVALFNITAEIIVVFIDYDDFEPRTFDVFDYIKSKLEEGRVENLCGVLVSKDKAIENKISMFLTGTETRIFIPYSYDELTEKRADTYIFRNKFQKFFYSRDLFAFDDALKTDLYFFGRDQIVMNVIDRHLSNRNTGLFGLRKTGKTSIIYDIKRKIHQKHAIGIFISCQDPSVSTGTWVDAVYSVVCSIYEQSDIQGKCPDRSEFNNITATTLLLDAVNHVYDQKKCTVLLLFDEVEHITFKKSADEKWGKGTESIEFWKAIRSGFQKQNSRFTYCIIGTNPICIEYPTILHAENPIFNGVTPLYIPGFDVKQTRGMVRKLGRIMGIKFEETLYAKMTEDYGGHPFLIRHVCSYIAQKYPDRPVQIDRVKYAQCKEEFNRTQGKYFEMILEVLAEFYPDEYEMLKYLSMEDYDTFEFFAREDYSMVEHLIGYGIIRKVDDYYDFQMDVIKDYILHKENVNRKLVSREEKWAHLCTNRGNFEIEMRKMIKQVLLLGFQGKKNEAKEHVMSKIYNDKNLRRKYFSYDYGDLFDPDKCEIYLKSLTTLLVGKWDWFSSYMGDITQEEFIHTMDILNDEGRFDAHGKIPNDDDLVLFDAAISKMGKIVTEYKKLME